MRNLDETKNSILKISRNRILKNSIKIFENNKTSNRDDVLAVTIKYEGSILENTTCDLFN